MSDPRSFGKRKGTLGDMYSNHDHCMMPLAASGYKYKRLLRAYAVGIPYVGEFEIEV